MNEAETRAEHIDPALAAAGWGVVEGSRIRREYPITLGRLEGAGKRGKALAADYVLEYRNTKLASIEAKAWDLELTEGVGQAKNYSGRLSLRFAYSSNGRGVYEVDMETGAEGKVASFPTPEELWSRIFPEQNDWRDRFAAVPFEDKGGFFQGRYYQDIAIDRVLAAIADGRERILLTLATGTGKTFIGFQIAWKLFYSRWNLSDWKSGKAPKRRPRILFLADRNVLANQAFNAFSAFEDRSPGSCVRISPEEIRKTGKPPKNGSIFFTIFQTFMSGQPKDGEPSPYFGEYPPDFFDFIVIDECHRGGANDESTWRAILDYFSPAVQLGLTATPKRKDNVDTYAYFGEPVYVYSLKDGINDGFLTPFRVRQIATTLDEYIYTTDDTVVEGEIEAGKLYEEPDFNRTIQIEERERKRVEIFMSQIDQREKTLVFCANAGARPPGARPHQPGEDQHGPELLPPRHGQRRQLGDQHLAPSRTTRRPSQRSSRRPRSSRPASTRATSATSSCMRPINSMIEFKQIIGRGTRLYEGKDYFTIYDFVKAHEHFNDPEWDGEPVEPETCAKCGQYPCVCEKTPPQPCAVCGEQPCVCEKPTEPCPVCGKEPCICKKQARAKVKLADGKERMIQHMTATTFWHPDGTPMSATQFMEALFGKLPEFFKDEDELRSLWGDPDTRSKLLDGLAENGFGKAQLEEMRRIISAEKSDIFDVLAFVAYASAPLTREERAERAKVVISTHFNTNRQAFLDFVLSHYVRVGVEELDKGKLTQLLRLRYKDSISDAVADLGSPEEIGQMFSGFQKWLYKQEAA
jgi:type I restriction enzyme R subunit